MFQSEAVAGTFRFRRIESELFETMGLSAARATDPAAKVVLNELSRHHGWRAEQWHLDVDPVVEAPPGSARPDLAGWNAVVGTIEVAASDPSGVATVESFAAVVGPWMQNSYQLHLAMADPISDAATIRTLGRVMNDLAADVRMAEGMLGVTFRA